VESRLTIGITVFVAADANIWSNGIQQNIGFLAQLLRQSPLVEKIFFLNGGDTQVMPPDLALDGLSVPLVRPQDVTHELDVVIEMGAVLPREWMLHARACGVRFVSFGVGHNYNAVVEGVLFNKAGIVLSDPALRVETWGLRHHSASCTPLNRTLTRKPVVEMPHLWSPYFLESRIRAASARGRGFGFTPGDRPERRGWNIGIFEPNIGVVKNCMIPMLVCEQAYRRNPQSVAKMMVMNSVHMKEHPTFLHFALCLDLTRHQKATYEPRVQFSDAMTQFALDAVVAHHWECGLNYAYYDALYGGYPLIHNSEFLRADGQGFFYPDFSAIQGGDVLVEAWSQPAEFWSDYRKRALEYLRGLSPEHPENVRIFTERLMQVVERSAA
jgi:hypothetical protein